MSTCLIELIKPHICGINIEEIAAHLCISPGDIVELDFWSFVLWCRVSGRGGVFVSPRQMSFWLPAIKKAIAHCRDLSSLEELKSALEVEFKSKYHKKTFEPIYPEALIAHLRQLVKERWQEIILDTAARRQAESLSQSYESIIQHCQDKESLYGVGQLIKKNYAIFQPFPDILPHLRQVWACHRQEIRQRIIFEQHSLH